MKKSKFLLVFFLLFLFTVTVSAQARLTVQNNSGRLMTVKVMKGSGKGTLHETIAVQPWSCNTVYFSESGTYFTKTKATISGRDPVYRKGGLFQVTNDITGYSVMTLSFSIKESSVPQVTGGKLISKSEFDLN